MNIVFKNIEEQKESANCSACGQRLRPPFDGNPCLCVEGTDKVLCGECGEGDVAAHVRWANAFLALNGFVQESIAPVTLERNDLPEEIRDAESYRYMAVAKQEKHTFVGTGWFLEDAIGALLQDAGMDSAPGRS